MLAELRGAYLDTSRGYKVMDPWAPDGKLKWATHGRMNPYFGWWAFHAWVKVFYPVFAVDHG